MVFYFVCSNFPLLIKPQVIILESTLIQYDFIFYKAAISKSHLQVLEDLNIYLGEMFVNPQLSVYKSNQIKERVIFVEYFFFNICLVLKQMKVFCFFFFKYEEYIFF